MNAFAKMRSGVSAVCRKSAIVGTAVCLAAVVALAPQAAAFDKVWWPGGCSQQGTSHGLLDGMSDGSAEVGIFWIFAISSANESCAYNAGVNVTMPADGWLGVRVKVDPRARFQLAAYGTQGDIACAKNLGVLTLTSDDGLYHSMYLPLSKWTHVDCLRIVLDDDPNASEPFGEYINGFIDSIRIGYGRSILWSESFSD